MVLTTLYSGFVFGMTFEESLLRTSEGLAMRRQNDEVGWRKNEGAEGDDQS